MKTPTHLRAILPAGLATALLLTLASPAALAGKGTPPPKLTKKPPPAPAGFKLGGDAKKGKKVYKKYCTKCHGKKGNGGGLMAKDLKVKPRDFTHPANASRTDWQLFIAIKQGGKPLGLSDKMTPWKDTLTDREIRDVAAYIRTFHSSKR